MAGKRIRSVWFGVFAATISMSGCATSRSDFVVALPNGYQIVSATTSEPMIVKRGGRVIVRGPVDQYTVVRDLVVGLVQPPTPKKPSFVPEPPPPGQSERKPHETPKTVPDQGYFVLDTRSGELSKGLSEADYTARLKSLNISSPPKLSPPVLPE